MARTCLALICLLHASVAFIAVADDLEECVGETCDKVAPWTEGEEGSIEGMEMLQKASAKMKSGSQSVAQAEHNALQEIRRSWREGGNCTARSKGVGTHAPIAPHGYFTVANLCCNYQMEYYITRTILTLGYKVCDQGAVMGLVPWHSCQGAQTLAKLFEDIHSAAPGVTTCPFVQNSTLDCPELGEECLAASASYANVSYHRRRVCGKNTVADWDSYGLKPGSPSPSPPGTGGSNIGGGGGGTTYVPGGTTYIPGGKWTPGSVKTVYQGPLKPDWPTPAPAPPVLPCRAVFQNRGGTRIMQQWALGSGEVQLDEACCALCTAHAGCTHWVREASSMGPVKCWLQENAAVAESKSNTLRGGWKKPDKCGGDKTCKAAFTEFSGTRIIKVGVCGADNKELDAACCFECRNHEDCEFWIRDTGDKGTLGCQLMRNPGTEYKDRPLSRGGFKQGCGPFPVHDAQFQEMAGSQIRRLVICGETVKELDGACSYLCDQYEDCEHWVRDVISPWKAFSANVYCYLRKAGNQVQAANANRRGGFTKKCDNQKLGRCGASFQDLAGTLVENQRVCGKTDQELDNACCDKCRQNSLCHFWVREKANMGFRHCWLRRDEKGKPAVSATRRGGYKESQACGDAYLNINCKATFQQMTGSEAHRQNVCGKTDAELDAHCCFLCRNHTMCEFWVRDIRKATDGAERPVMCYLRYNPGAGSKNANLVGGWKMPCKRQVPECTATFQERGGPQVDKVGVCGTSVEHLDAQCCNECAKTPDCEFWVREVNNPDYRHGALNSSFCYLRKLGALNPSNNANRRGGWNRICGSPDTPACWASFQEAAGSQVAQLRVCGKDDADLDSECCAKCKKNDYCDFWVREKGSNGYKYCWLRKLPASGKLAKTPNANRRGGWPTQMVCGDKYASNGCRSTFRDIGGAQVGYDFVCGKNAAELDAHCCELCRNFTDTTGKNTCSFWVREVPQTTDGAIRPMTCWLRKNPGNGGNNKNRAGGWKQGCGNNLPEHKPEFQDRGGAQVEKVGVCGETLAALDNECSDLCAKNPECEFWVREVNLPTIAQGGTNTQFCYLRKNGAVNPSNNANKRGAFNRICGSVKAPYTCVATFQEMAGPQIAQERVCGKTDAAVDAECCERCRDSEFCDYWVREKGTGFQWCYLRRFHPNGAKTKSAHGNRRGGLKQSKVCGDAYVQNGCRSTFKEMGGAQASLEFTCGKNDDELDAMCCALCRNNTKCTHWVREIRPPNVAATRPLHCWLRYNTGNPSNNNNRRGGWRQGCGGQHEECKATFQERGGPQVLRLGVCGKTEEKLDSACCDLCKKNPDCEFWVREVNYPATAHGGTNTQFCYLRKNGALTSSNSNTKRGAWNPLRCTAEVAVPCKASFQDWAGDQVQLHRVCGLSDAAIDAQCCKLCRDNILCDYWVRETRATGGNTGFWNCWLRRNGRMTGNANTGYSRNMNANVNRRGGFKISEPCGDAYLDNKCKASFKQLGGSQAAYTFVCGSSDDELDAHCCAKCRNNTKCEYWVREAGTSGSKQCWLRYNPGGFQNHHQYRGAPREGCGSTNQRKSEFQEWPGPEVDRFPVCGANNDEIDGACGDKCADNEDCEYWVRESGSTGFKMCWLRKIPQGNARGSGARRGGFKTCKSGELDVRKASFQNSGGSHIATTRICGKNNDEWDSHCAVRCDENMDCAMWLRQAGNDGGNSNYKYCWLYKIPTTVSNHPNRRGGYKQVKVSNPTCEATFKDMPGKQTFQIRVWGENDKVLDAMCCHHCTKSFACDFWVREKGTGLHEQGGKWCWLRKKTTENPTKQNNNNRRGGMKIQSLLEEGAASHQVKKESKEEDLYVNAEDAEKEDEEGASDDEVNAEQNALEYGEEDTPTEEQNAEALAQNKAAFKELTGEEWKEDEEEDAVEDSPEVDHEAEQAIPKNELGQKASLDEPGYKAVAALKSNKQMENFIRRAAQSANLKIHDEGGFQGIVPYYSGVNAAQTYEGLLLELERTANSGTGAWIRVPAGDEQ